MDNILAWFEGKKTILLALIYMIFALATGQEVDETAVAGFDPAAIKESLMALMIATVKAAWDRFANR